MLPREGVVEPVGQDAVEDLGRSHAVTPTLAVHQIWRAVHVLHAAAIATSLSPAAISSAADRIACAPEPQTRLTVRAGIETGSPPPMEAWRAGFILLPAWMTFPITTVPTSSPESPERRRVSRTTVAPSSVAATPFSAPLKAPIAVRTGCARTISRLAMVILPFWINAQLMRRSCNCLRRLWVGIPGRGLFGGRRRIEAARAI